MTTPAQIARRAPFMKCRCGKRGWKTKFDADQVVVNAKILRHLHHNNRRQEQRSYRCTTDATLWHVTSQEERVPGLRHALDDDVAAAEFVESILLAEFSRDTDHVWEWLVAPERVAQTERVMSTVHQAGLKDGADRKAALARTKKTFMKGGGSKQRYDLERNAYQEWVLHWSRFQAALVARKAQARDVRRQVNIARSADEVANEKHHLRHVLAQVACAIAEHRDRADTPSESDRALWAVLDSHKVAYRGAAATLAELVAGGVWEFDGADEVAAQ